MRSGTYSARCVASSTLHPAHIAPSRPRERSKNMKLGAHPPESTTHPLPASDARIPHLVFDPQWGLRREACGTSSRERPAVRPTAATLRKGSPPWCGATGGCPLRREIAGGLAQDVVPGVAHGRSRAEGPVRVRILPRPHRPRHARGRSVHVVPRGHPTREAAGVFRRRQAEAEVRGGDPLAG